MNNLRVRAYRIQRINSQFANRKKKRKKKEVEVRVTNARIGLKRSELREISHRDR